MSKMRYRDSALYIIGPVTGKRNDNIEAFREARIALRAAGYSDVSIPHDYIAPGTEWRRAMRRSIGAICLRMSAIATLDGYRESRGATFERDVADRLGIPVMPVDWWIENADRQVGL